jgi:SET domain-containing protein
MSETGLKALGHFWIDPSVTCSVTSSPLVFSTTHTCPRTRSRFESSRTRAPTSRDGSPVAGTGVVPKEPTDIPAAVAVAQTADVLLAVGGRSAWSDERTEGEWAVHTPSRP